MVVIRSRDRLAVLYSGAIAMLDEMSSPGGPFEPGNGFLEPLAARRLCPGRMPLWRAAAVAFAP